MTKMCICGAKGRVSDSAICNEHGPYTNCMMCEHLRKWCILYRKDLAKIYFAYEGNEEIRTDAFRYWKIPSC